MHSDLSIIPISDVVRRDLLSVHQCVPMQVIQSGLSGASIWRCKAGDGGLACLRAWPEAHPSQERLQEIHQHMRLLTACGIAFTPELYCSRSGSTLISDSGRWWELTTWLPGKADYLPCSSGTRLRSAMEALARIHHVWSLGRGVLSTRGTQATAVGSPTLSDRLTRLATWQARRHELRRLLPRVDCAAERQLVVDTSDVLDAWCEPLRQKLLSLAEQAVEQHFVLRDIWSEHVLFAGDEVTGVIDFGAARWDEPTTDLVRLLGSLEPHSTSQRQMALEAYNQVRSELAQGLSGELVLTTPTTLARAPRFEPLRWERFQVLDQTATLLSAAQWLEWLVLEDRDFVQPRNELLERWRGFIERMRGAWE
jgi:Ser/Thr protein kinase RdoA (MazF antagonist)